jgi:kexin
MNLRIQSFECSVSRSHGVATGEKTKPAFSTANPTVTSTIHDDITGTAGTGWLFDISNLLTNQKWLFIALGAVLLFGIAMGIDDT